MHLVRIMRIARSVLIFAALLFSSQLALAQFTQKGPKSAVAVSPSCASPQTFTPTVGAGSATDPQQPFSFTLPDNISLVTIEAAGAQGGNGGGHGGGGLGAEVAATFPVTPGQTLCAVVGVAGGNQAGGGGSFVYAITSGTCQSNLAQVTTGGAPNLLLAVGGGGGNGPAGTGGGGIAPNGAGAAGASAGGAGGFGGGGGTGGNGGGNGIFGGGGGGLASDGGSYGAGGGRALINGADGGNGYYGNGYNGGFGAGGGGGAPGGGGGGYNGGGGGGNKVIINGKELLFYWFGGGGGGSYSMVTPTVARNGAQSGNGFVKLCSVYVPAHDFDGDGKSDILWRHIIGPVAIWQMNGTQVIGGGSVATVTTDWTVAGTGDFDGDGKSDLLWHHVTGSVAIWQMNGTQVVGGGNVAVVTTDWAIAGTGDFNGDGKQDILWRHTSGATAVWEMNGTQIIGGGAIIGCGGTCSIPAGWSISVGDFNGDGMSDLLLRDISGNTVMWLMNGNQIMDGGNVVAVTADWSIAGIGDFNGDGKSDILWRHTSGAAEIWMMNGTQVIGGGAIIGCGGTCPIPAVWSVSIGDFNGDTRSDLLLRDTGGNTVMWLMNGNQIINGGNFAVVPTDWRILN